MLGNRFALSLVGIKCLLFINISTEGCAQIQNKAIFSPDTSVSGICLRNPQSVMNVIGSNLTFSERTEFEFPVACYRNSNDSSVLRMFFYYGDLENQVSLFEVSNCDLLPFDSTIQRIGINNFVTDSGIMLGTSKQHLVEIKGLPIATESVDGLSVFHYEISEPQSGFLERYQMPSYFADYYLSNDRVVKFIFGFGYP